MWSLTITNPRSEPLQVQLVPGKMVIGRLNTCDIIIDDVAASRRHAEIIYDPLPDLVTIKDLKSSNGTHVNRRKLEGLMRLQHGDVIRIGKTTLNLEKISAVPDQVRDSTGTRLFSKDLLLETSEERPAALTEVISKLDALDSLEPEYGNLVDLLRQAMDVDVCRIIPARDFASLNMQDITDLKVRAVRNVAAETSPLALCVPVINAGKPIALIVLERTRSGANRFEQRDVQNALSISQQVALTMQRIELQEEARNADQARRNLLRMVSPLEADDLLKEYLETGVPPAIAERKVAVLYVEISDPTGPVDRKHPRFLSSFLAPFYDFTTQTVFKYGGMVKFLGDGVLAVFLKTRYGSGPEERAVNVGQEVIAFIKHSAPFEDDQVGVVGVAVTSGLALVGYVGSPDRLEFNVTGDLIKQVVHIQELALPNRLLVGPATAEAVRSKCVLLKAGTITIPGLDHPIELSEVSLIKTAPFEQSAREGGMAAAFKSVSEKLRTRGK